MEPSKDAISVRLARLNSQFLGRGLLGAQGRRPLHREGLLDALAVLYDECNNEALKRGDQQIAGFVEKYRSALLELRQMRVNIADFEVKDLIGRGHYGEVHVVREKQTGDVYAMKTLRKESALRHKEKALFEEERDIMALAVNRSPWLLPLQYAFQDASRLYLVTEYCPGGDLSGLLERRGRPLQEPQACFYLSQLLQALGELHRLGYVHRDIKPDNILLDRCGHIKLADFGSAARLSPSGRVSSRAPVGTPNYIAPEILQAMESDNTVSHGPPCDYWSYGIVAYELVTCQTPFGSCGRPAAGATAAAQVYSAILRHAASSGDVRFPPDVREKLSPAYVGLVGGLLQPESKRMDHEAVLRHPLFKGVKWNTLRQQTPPVVPVVTSVDDTSNFMEIEKQKNVPSVENFRTRNQFSGRNLPFIGFTYVQDMSQLGAAAPNCNGDSVEQTSDSSDPNRSFLNASLNGTAICVTSIREMEKLLESRKLEIESLHKRVATLTSSQVITGDKDSKIAGLQEERARLERELAQMAVQNQKFHHQLTTEHEERKTLEAKSLQLIRSAKRRWQDQMEAAKRVSDLALQEANGNLEKANSQVRELQVGKEQAEARVRDSNKELEALKKLQQSHKDSMAKVRRMSRQSIVDVEQMCSESTSRLQLLARELSEEKKRSAALQSKMEERERDRQTAIRVEVAEAAKDHEAQVEELNLKITDLQYKMLELEEQNKYLVNAGTRKISEGLDHSLSLQAALSKEKSTASQLQRRIEDLEFSVCSLESDCIEKDAIAAEQEKLLAVTKAKLETATSREEKYKEKVQQMEGLLQKLQQEVTRLEAAKDKKMVKEASSTKPVTQTKVEACEDVLPSEKLVLQEQVKRLEEQLAEAQQELGVLKQEARKINSNLWKKEKELSDCDLDRRIATRELKQAEGKVKVLEEEKTKLLATHAESLKISRQACREAEGALRQARADLQDKVTELKSLEGKLKDTVDEGKKECEEVKRIGAELDRWKNDVHRLKAELQYSENRRLKSEGMVERSLAEAKVSEAGRCEEREARARLEVALQERDRECLTLQTNYKMLQEACTVLDEQLVDFERVTEAQEETNKTLKDEISSLRLEVEKLTLELGKQQRLHEGQSCALSLLENKYREALAELQQERTHQAQMEKQIESLLERETGMTLEVSSAREDGDKLSAELQQARAEVRACRMELTSLKEELSQLLTDSADIREEALRAQLALRECQDNNGTLSALLEERGEELLAQQAHGQQRELKAEATIAQQIKLIDFLQSKVEEISKKKKTFGDMLFGGKSSFKENVVPATPQTPGYARTLAKEKQTNRELTDQLAALQLKLDILQGKSVTKDLTKQEYICDDLLSTPRRPTATSDVRKRINSTALPDITMEGWVRIQKGDGLEKVYMKLCGATLEWRGGCAGARGELLLAGGPQLYPQHNLKHCDNVPDNAEAFKLVTDVTSQWPSRCLVVVCPSARQKQDWLVELQRVPGVRLQQEDQEKQELGKQDTSQLPPGKSLLETRIRANCIVQLEPGLFLIGADTGLFSHEQGRSGAPLSIPGCSGVAVIRGGGRAGHAALLGAGGTRGRVSHASWTALTAAARTGAKLALQHVQLGKENACANTIEMNSTRSVTERLVLCAATDTQLFIFCYEAQHERFLQVRCLTSESIRCLKLTPHSLLVGSHKFYEVDLKNYRVEEFLDPSDVTISHAVYAHKKQIYPSSIVQVKNQEFDKDTEYLLCYKDFGLFVDAFGQRSRSEDVKWAHVPLHIVFRRPFLFVVYANTVEILNLKETSFDKSACRDDVSIASGSTIYSVPDKKVIDFDAPKYLGKSMTQGCVFVMFDLKNNAENRFQIMELSGNAAFISDIGVSIETLDTIDDNDSCKNVKAVVSEDQLSVDDDKGSFNDSIEVKTDFASHIKQKARLMSSVKKENKKVDSIQNILSGNSKSVAFKLPKKKRYDSDETDSSDTED